MISLSWKRIHDSKKQKLNKPPTCSRCQAVDIKFNFHLICCLVCYGRPSATGVSDCNCFSILERRVKAQIFARMGGFIIIYRDVKNKERVRLGLSERGSDLCEVVSIYVSGFSVVKCLSFWLDLKRV